MSGPYENKWKTHKIQLILESLFKAFHEKIEIMFKYQKQLIEMRDSTVGKSNDKESLQLAKLRIRAWQDVFKSVRQLETILEHLNTLIAEFTNQFNSNIKDIAFLEIKSLNQHNPFNLAPLIFYSSKDVMVEAQREPSSTKASNKHNSSAISKIAVKTTTDTTSERQSASTVLSSSNSQSDSSRDSAIPSYPGLSDGPSYGNGIFKPAKATSNDIPNRQFGNLSLTPYPTEAKPP